MAILLPRNLITLSATLHVPNDFTIQLSFHRLAISSTLQSCLLEVNIIWYFWSSSKTYLYLVKGILYVNCICYKEILNYHFLLLFQCSITWQCEMVIKGLNKKNQNTSDTMTKALKIVKTRSYWLNSLLVCKYISTVSKFLFHELWTTYLCSLTVILTFKKHVQNMSGLRYFSWSKYFGRNVRLID